jgi:hypothetical protein
MLLLLTIAFTAVAAGLCTGGFIASSGPHRHWRAFVRKAMRRR